MTAQPVEETNVVSLPTNVSPVAAVPTYTATLVAKSLAATALTGNGALLAKEAFAVSFVESAKETAKALAAGVTALSISKEVETLVKANPELGSLPKGSLYGSPAAIGYHARAGQVFLLPGDLPKDIFPHDVQKSIRDLGALSTKGGGTKFVEAIIKNSVSCEQAATLLRDELARINAEVAAAEANEAATAEADAAAKAKAEAEANKTPLTDDEAIVKYCKSATGPVNKVVELLKANAAGADAAQAIRELKALVATL